MTAYIAGAVNGTVSELLVTRQALAALGTAWQARRKFRSRSASLRALPLLLDYPVVTVGRLAAKLSMTWAQASAAVDQLVDAAIP